MEMLIMAGDDGALNDEAIKHLGYMQPKKAHDAAMVLITRICGEKPRFNCLFGSSQGGRERLTEAQRYPADCDGAAANVPTVNSSLLTLAPGRRAAQPADVLPSDVSQVRRWCC